MGSNRISQLSGASDITNSSSLFPAAPAVMGCCCGTQCASSLLHLVALQGSSTLYRLLQKDTFKGCIKYHTSNINLCFVLLGWVGSLGSSVLWGVLFGGFFFIN